MDAATRRAVRARAGNRCEYCQLTQAQSPLAKLHVEHVRPIKHQGRDDIDNLALACIDCNLHKGTNVAGYDPLSGALTPLFHPRQHGWEEHFRWQGVYIVGITPIGRTTVAVLDLNGAARLELRSIQ